MKKITVLLIIFFNILISEAFAGTSEDGSYFWNSTSITTLLNEKTELYFGNKDHFSNQTDHLDYFHFELIGYRKISQKFSLGLGLRQTESYKSERWNPGQTYMLYGVYFLNPWDIKIKFANRFALRTYKTSDTQYGFDNITNIDFFTRSASKFPKPYLMDELFSSLNLGKVQTVRLYGGFHILKKEHFGIDLYYCYWKTRSTAEWKNYNVLGLSTKFRI
jgi:hypothetical protein